MKIINKTNIVIVLRNPGNIVRQGEKGCRDWKEKKKKTKFIIHKLHDWGDRKETTGKLLECVQHSLQGLSKATVY